MLVQGYLNRTYVVQGSGYIRTALPGLLIMRLQFIKEYIGMPPGLSVIATGLKNGKRIKITIGNNHVPFGAMAGVTSIPLAIAAFMVINGEIKEKGVLTPEEAFSDPMGFFDRYAKYCGKNLTGKDVLLEREVEL